jgi:hypothetical protein
MKNLYYLSILLLFTITFNSCKSCDEVHCQGTSFEQIKLVFNLDSLNGQFKKSDLDSILIIETDQITTVNRRPDKNGQFTIIT